MPKFRIEKDSIGKLKVPVNTWRIDYIWANGEPKARVEPTNHSPLPIPDGGEGLLIESDGGGGGSTEYYFWYHNDHLGTPYVVTDKDKLPVWRISLNPFGETVLEEVSLSNELRFPGQFLDRESGLNYNWHRFYQPKVGRYYQADPLLDLGLMNRWSNSATWLKVRKNSYSYVGNNPVKRIDPLRLIDYPDIEAYLDETPLAGVYKVASFIGSARASATCFSKCMLESFTVSLPVEGVSHYGGRGFAMAWYHFRDRRFKAWGTSSKVLVPRLGLRISTVGTVAVLSYEAYQCFKKCRNSCPTE